MDKHSKITIIAIVVIIIPFVYSGLNIYAATQVHYRWSEYDKFNYFTMSNNGNLELCNGLPYWVNFKKIDITTFYNLENKGTFTVEPLIITPYSHTTQRGVFYSENLTEAQYLFMEIDFELNGGTVRLDPSKMNILVNIDTPIIGIIPYSTTIKYSGFDFNKIMKEDKFEC
jgi:hypothetical protein